MLKHKEGRREFWTCRKFKKKNINCKARASTMKNYIMKLTGVHNHDPDDVEILTT